MIRIGIKTLYLRKICVICGQDYPWYLWHLWENPCYPCSSSVPFVVTKIPHFIGTFSPSIQNGQNGLANGQNGQHPLSSFLLIFASQNVIARKTATIRDENHPFFIRGCKNNGSQWNEFQKKCLSLQARVTLCDFPCGRLTSFDPSENLENSMYMGEKFEGCSTCNAYA